MTNLSARGKNQHTATWTPEDDQILRDNATKTASQIGAMVGRSRNAVIGRMGRLGIRMLSGKKNNPPNRGFGDIIKKARVRPPKNVVAAKVSAPAERPAPLPIRLSELSLPRRPDQKTAPWVSHGAHQCKAVMDELHGLKTAMCAHQRRAGSSYCEWHHKRFNIKAPPPKPRERD